MAALRIKRALLSVSDKTGLVPFAQTLAERGVELLSTGGTYRTLAEAHVPVTEVAAHTGFPEIMDGRVKTLHPKIHGGILARRGEDDEALKAHDIDAIDLVVVNLYPFAQTIERQDCTELMAIENIDIGGPTMVRAAAKNHHHVLVVVDPSDYEFVLQAQQNSQLDRPLSRRLAVKAFRHTAQYDAVVARYLGQDEVLPDTLSLSFDKVQDLRYGENPHQQAGFYRETGGVQSGTVASATQLQGKSLSYNNIADTDAALECVRVFDEPACVIVKHANPCGVAVADTIGAAYDQAFTADPTSAFGGIIAFNRPLDEQTMQLIIQRQFAEVIIAPAVEPQAQQAASSKKNLRVLACGDITQVHRGQEYKRVGGGMLVQSADESCLDSDQLRVVTKLQPSEAQMRDLLFAWRVAWFVKSNAIVYARDGATVGIGAGQMSRVVSAKIADLKAAEEGLAVTDAVMASDAFFPFRDGIDAAAEAGIRAVIQPGGSMRDQEVIDAADQHGLSMVFTGVRHFRH